MQDRSIPINFLLTETLRVIPKFLLLVTALAVACTALYFFPGSPRPLPVVVGTFFALTYFSAPIASSSVRYKLGLRLLSRAGRKTLLYSFAWGAVVVACFIATLQLWQGMEATALNYVLSMGLAGFVCAATATIPTGR